tara:strand:+ start:815 stop:1114 length:300 start_codon:yes stop_codon:yes gene_type:complete
MRNLFLVIALFASNQILSQTTLVVNDLNYSKGIETEWSVLHIPHCPEVESKYLEEDNEWCFRVRDNHRSFILKATEPGIYQVTQLLDDVIIQISSVRVD